MKKCRIRIPKLTAKPPVLAAIALSGNQQKSQPREDWLAANKPARQNPLSVFAPNEADDNLRLQELVWNHVNDNFLYGTYEGPPLGQTWRDCVVDVLRIKLEEPLRLLSCLARNDTRAAKLLLDLTVRSTERLTELAESKTKRMRAVTERSLLWPFLAAGQHGMCDDKKAIGKRIRALRLGTKVPFSKETIRRLPKNERNELRRFVSEWLIKLDEYRHPSLAIFKTEYEPWRKRAEELPEPSANTWKEWSEVAIEAIWAFYGGFPEGNSILKRIGRSGAQHYERIDVQKTAATKTVLSNQRQRMRDAIRDLIRTLAGAPRKARKKSS